MNHPTPMLSRPARPASAAGAGQPTDPLEAWRLSRSVARLREVAELTSDMQVLEIGCGDGALTANLAGSGARIVAVDPQVERVALARRRHLGARIRFCAEHPDHLICDDGTFDIAVGIQVLSRFPIDGCLRELARVVRAGGRIAFVEPNRRASRKAGKPALIPHGSLQARLAERGFVNIHVAPFGFATITANRAGGRRPRWERVVERLPFMGAAADLLLVTATRGQYLDATAATSGEKAECSPVLCA